MCSTLIFIWFTTANDSFGGQSYSSSAVMLALRLKRICDIKHYVWLASLMHLFIVGSDGLKQHGSGAWRDVMIRLI